MGPKDRIGIFRGRKGLHNEAILRVLLSEGSLTAWGITKAIQQARDPNINKEIADSRLHKIYSLIHKKGRRLDELLKKDYIVQNDDGKSLLTLKGLFVIIMLAPSAIRRLNPEYYNIISIDSFPIPRKTPFTNLPVNRKIVRKKLRKIKDLLKRKPLLWVDMAMKIEKLIETGLDLDTIKNHDLMLLMCSKELSTQISDYARSKNEGVV